MRPRAVVAACAAATLAVLAAPARDASADRYGRDAYQGPECLGESRVIGRSECAEFGRWALPPDLPRVQVTFGVSVRDLGEHGLDLGGAGSPPQVAALIAGGADPRGAVVEGPGGMGGDVIAFDLRMTGELTRALYTGIDVSVGRARISHPRFERAAGVTIEETGGMYYGAGGVGGLVLHGGPLVVRAEILGGARLAEVALSSEEDGLTRRSRASAVQPILEPRVGAELWLGPWLTLGAHVGSDVLRDGDLFLGLRLSIYGRAYNDSRSRPRGTTY
jgi:hypothetical protein